MLQAIIEVEWSLAILLALILCVYMLRRGVLRSRWLFFVYILYEFVSGSLLWIFRTDIFTVQVVTPKELLSDLLVLLLAVSVADRVFLHYAGIRNSLRVFLFLTLIASLVYGLYLPELFRSSDHFWYALNLMLHPRLLMAGASLFVIITAAIRYYHLKLDRADKRLILGFLILLGPNAFILSLVDRAMDTADVRDLCNIGDLALYCIALVIWISIYWRRYECLDSPGGRATQHPAVRAV